MAVPAVPVATALVPSASTKAIDILIAIEMFLRERDRDKYDFKCV